MALPAPVDGAAPGYFGVYPAIVTDLVDDRSLGRVQVRFPWLGEAGDADVRAWATLCSPYADDRQGLLALPEVGSQVVVAFEGGNLRRPYVIGSTWNGEETLPHPPEAANDVRLFRSRRDSRLEFDDGPSPSVRLTMEAGHSVVLDEAAQTVTITHSTGAVVRLTTTAIDLQANVAVNVTAPTVKVDAPMATFSGFVKVGTLIAEQMVMSPAYTPGAGNIW
jgi:uncharacterized protein involved in type VI secretion and phage assembly